MALPIGYNIRSLQRRWQATLLAIGGIALVVAVLIVILSMANGFRLALASTGSPSNAIVTQKGSLGELSSGIARNHTSLIGVDDRIARDADGTPLASPEVVIVANLNRRTTGEPTNVLIRGVTPRAFKVRSNVDIVDGRNLTPGLNEVIVGRRIQDRISSTNIGDVLRLQSQDWTVVGAFSAGGSGFESEIWGDADVMAPAFNRGGGYQSLTVRLDDPAALSAFVEEWESNPQMQMQVTDERSYYEAQAGPTAATLLGLAGFVAVIMGIGAVFGAMNTMYAIIAARTREIGTLRALGFPRTSIMLAFVLESTLLALCGGVLGCLLALPANGITAATGNATFSELAFAFKITGGSLAAGLSFALVMGVAGGLLPAWRAARLPITSALREA